jgi:hypothetical protein
MAFSRRVQYSSSTVAQRQKRNDNRRDHSEYYWCFLTVNKDEDRVTGVFVRNGAFLFGLCADGGYNKATATATAATAGNGELVLRWLQ